MSQPSGREAPVDHPVLDAIRRRWSPYAYSDDPVDRDDLLAILEAGRWAASAYNEQPWSYLLATADDAEAFAKLCSCLVEPNQVWAQRVPVLLIGIASLHYRMNGKPNGTALHDLGLANGQMVLEATARGLQAHQMGGILPDRVRELYAVPEGHQPLMAMGIGYPGENPDLPESYRSREDAPRTRRALAEYIYGRSFGEAAAQVE